MGWSNSGWRSDQDGWYKNAAAGGGTPFAIAFIGSANNVVGAATSFTFTSQGIGTADATRLVVVCISDATVNTGVTSVTIGGSAATQATGAAGNSTAGGGTDIWYLAVPAGTTATIVVNYGVSQTRCAIDVYRVVGTTASFSAANKAISATGVQTLGAAVSVPAGGGAIAVLNVHSSTVAGTVVNGGNLTIDQNGVAFGNSTVAAGSNTSASGSTTFTMNWTGAADSSLSVATFTP